MPLARVLVVGSPVAESTIAAVAEDRFEVEFRTADEVRGDKTEMRPDAILISETVASNLDLQELFQRQIPIIIGVDTLADLKELTLATDVSVEYLFWEDFQERPEIAGQRIARFLKDQGVNTSAAHEQMIAALNLFRDAQEVIGDPDLSTNERIDRIVELASEMLDYPIAFVSRISDDKQEIIAATGEHELLQAGAVDDISRSYCRRTIQRNDPLVVTDAPAQGWSEDPAFERYGLGSYVGATIQTDDEPYGTVCFADTKARPELVVETQQAIVETLAHLISAELQQPVSRIQTIFNNTPDPIIIYDSNGEIIEVNETATKVLGYDAETLEQLTVQDIEVGIEREKFRNLLANPPDDRPLILEGTHERKDGNTMPVEVWISQVEIGPEKEFIAVVRDISKRVKYEQRLEEQRNNLELLNQVMRHDIRNDLQLIQAYAEELREQVSSDGEDYLDIIADSAADSIALTETARELADIMLQTEADYQEVSVNESLNEEIKRVRSAYPNATITVDGTIPDANVVGTDMINTVFRNILGNAVQHNDKAIPQIEIASAIISDQNQIEIRIADNGPGIKDSHKEEIFGEGERGLDSPGTGLGLYLSKSLVDSYGGDIWVEDNDPEGAVFVIRLPVAEQS